MNSRAPSSHRRPFSRSKEGKSIQNDERLVQRSRLSRFFLGLARSLYTSVLITGILPRIPSRALFLKVL